MVKKILIPVLLLAMGMIAQAQNLNPVSWTFTSKKIADKTYEVHLTATIQDGWHLYSQVQPSDAIAEPTTITLNKNPLLTFLAKPKEVGKVEKFHDAKIGASANQYSSKVEFVQTVKLKSNAKTKVGGSIRFQTCNDERCLPPKVVNFSVDL